MNQIKIDILIFTDLRKNLFDYKFLNFLGELFRFFAHQTSARNISI